MNRPSPLFAATAAAIAALTLAATPARVSAQATDWPTKPVRILTPFPAGAGPETVTRVLAEKLGKLWGKPVIVENRPGANGFLAISAFKQGDKDGYDLIQLDNVHLSAYPYLFKKLPYDPQKDFELIDPLFKAAFFFTVPVNSPYKTVGDIVADAKAKPGKLTYASAGIGGATHVGMEEFLMVAGAQMNHIPFKGGSDALQALLGGHVDALIDSSSWAPHVQSGKLRLLATWGEKRTNDFKSVPTLKESGYDVVIDAPNGIGAPKGLDPAVEKRLREAFKAAAASPGFAAACDRIDAPLMYLDGPDYEKYVATTVQKEKVLIERLKLKELMAKG